MRKSRRNCYKCISLIWNSQCEYDGSGIGNGEQAKSCVDFARTRLGQRIKDYFNLNKLLR